MQCGICIIVALETIESPTDLTNCSLDQLKQKGMGHWDLVSYPDYFLLQKCSLGMRLTGTWE